MLVSSPSKISALVFLPSSCIFLNAPMALDTPTNFTLQSCNVSKAFFILGPAPHDAVNES